MCGNWQCRACKKRVTGSDHRCLMRPQPLEHKQPRFIFFDFEAREQPDGEHVPNLCVANTCCPKCIDEPDFSKPCPSCGQRCTSCASWNRKQGAHTRPPCPDKCGNREVIFKGPCTVELFCQWLFDKSHAKYSVFAHNAKAYDNVFILRYIMRQGIKHKVIYRGSKLMYVRVESGLSMRLLDSLCFMPLPLAKLPKAFGIEDQVAKGYHL